MSIEGIEFSNPRKRAEIEGWPVGRTQKATAIFEVEAHPKRGERVKRTITGKPVFTTYAGKCAILDGSDGKTYIGKIPRIYGFVSIMQGDMKYDAGTVGENDPRYAELRALIQYA